MSYWIRQNATNEDSFLFTSQLSHIAFHKLENNCQTIGTVLDRTQGHGSPFPIEQSNLMSTKKFLRSLSFICRTSQRNRGLRTVHGPYATSTAHATEFHPHRDPSHCEQSGISRPILYRRTLQSYCPLRRNSGTRGPVLMINKCTRILCDRPRTKSIGYERRQGRVESGWSPHPRRCGACSCLSPHRSGTCG